MNRYGIRVSAAEAERGRLTRDSGEEADRVFRLMGFAVIENAIPIDVIESAKRVFLERFEPYFDGNDHEDALTVGHRRVMLTVPLEPPFDDPRLFAPPCVLHVLRGLLGKRFVLGGFGAVAALPGSELQHRHTDHPRLFGDDQLDNLLPPYAITVITPLIQLTEATGTTHMWVGSHRMPRELAKLGQSALPYPPPGLCGAHGPPCPARGDAERERRGAPDPVQRVLPAVVPRLRQLPQAGPSDRSPGDPRRRRARALEAPRTREESRAAPRRR